MSWSLHMLTTVHSSRMMTPVTPAYIVAPVFYQRNCFDICFGLNLYSLRSKKKHLIWPCVFCSRVPSAPASPLDSLMLCLFLCSISHASEMLGEYVFLTVAMPTVCIRRCVECVTDFFLFTVRSGRAHTRPLCPPEACRWRFYCRFTRSG